MEEVENEKQQFTLIVLYKTDRRKSSTSVKAELQIELNMTISQTTIGRRVHEIGLYEHVARKKPYLNKANRGKRLEYARTYREKPLAFWNNVIWSDESKFNLFGSDGKVMVWRSTEMYSADCETRQGKC